MTDTDTQQEPLGIKGKVNELTTSLSQGYLRSAQEATMAIALIRRCADGRISTDPRILCYTMQGFNEYEEWAASLALGLFATVQRSNHEISVQGSKSFMEAISEIASNHPEWEGGINRKFQFLMTTDSPGMLARQLSALASQMNADRHTACNWGELSQQLKSWQNPACRDSVRIQWGRAYFVNKKTSDKQ